MGWSESTGTGHGSEPSKWSHQSAVSMASWNRTTNIAQFPPPESRCRTSADNTKCAVDGCSLYRVGDSIGEDIAIAGVDVEVEESAEDRDEGADARGNVDGDAAFALPLEQVMGAVVVGTGPITCCTK